MLLPAARTNAEATENDAPPHDVDADGALSAQDAAAILSDCIGLAALPEDTGTDYNFDGSGTAADAAVLLRYVNGDMSRFPAAEGGYPAPVPAETEAAARRIIRRVAVIDFPAYAERLRDADLSVYDNLADNQPVFSEMARDMNRAISYAAASCLPLIAFDLSDLSVELTQTRSPQRRIGWKEMAALYRTFGARAARVIADSLIVDLETAERGGASFSVELSLFSEMIARHEETEQLGAKFALAYLNTVYDDAGVRKEYAKYELPASYLSGLIHPLNNENGQYWIKNGWYDARSHRTRLHTGTDILAPARTHILSMTDGSRTTT